MYRNPAPLSQGKLQELKEILGGRDGQGVMLPPGGIYRAWIQVIDGIYRQAPCEREEACDCLRPACRSCQYISDIFAQVRTAIRKDPSFEMILDDSGFTLDFFRYLKKRIGKLRSDRGRAEVHFRDAERMARKYPDWEFASRDILRTQAIFLSMSDELSALEEELLFQESSRKYELAV